MALRVRKSKTNRQSPATAAGSDRTFVRRPVLAGAVLTAVLLTMFAVKSLSSGAVTVPAPSPPTVVTPAPTVVTPALLHVPARDRLVLVDAALANSPPPARGTHVSGRATAARARLSAIHHGKVKLSFTLRAGDGNAKIKTLTVTLPSGMAFSRSLARLHAGIVLRTGGKRLKLTAKISRRSLRISLKTPASSVHVSIASPAVTVGKALAHRVRTRVTKALYTPVTTTNTNHDTTRLTLKERTR